MTEDRKNKIFWLLFIFILLGSIVATYVRVFVHKDYFLVQEVACDQTTESCLVHTPEELCMDSDYEGCVAETKEEFYKIIHKKAANIIECKPDTLKEGESCSEMICREEESEVDCYYEIN